MIKVALRERKYLSGLTKNQKELIKTDLTFKNPAYESALKFSRYPTTKIPKHLYYYEDLGAGNLAVPIGYEIKFPFMVVEDWRLGVLTDYPKPLLQLRENQAKAFEARKDMGTVILKTGEGKSIYGLYLAGYYKQKALVVVNKDDLIDGWEKDAKLLYGDIEVGLVKGKKFIIGKQVTLTTIQTLSKLGNEKLEKLWKSFGMVICDETHRAGAKSYQVLASFPAKYKLGLTATKMRNDGLVDVIDLLCGATYFDSTNLESEDIISPDHIHILRKDAGIYWKPTPTYFYTRTYKNVGDIKTKVGVLKQNGIEWKLEIKRLMLEGQVQENPLRLHRGYELIATDDNYNVQVCTDIIRNYTLGKSCVVFCRTIEHLEKIYDYLISNGCTKVQKFYGGMNDTKAEIKERAESKEALVTLATIAIATEGTNVKAWECGFLVDSVANEKDLIQILGRLRRKCEGKEDVFFYDYRFPSMVGFSSHGKKRDNWYKNLGINS